MEAAPVEGQQTGGWSPAHLGGSRWVGGRVFPPISGAGYQPSLINHQPSSTIISIIFSMGSYSGCPGGSSPLGFSLPCWLCVPASLVAVFLLRDVWGTKRQTLGHNSTGFHSTLVILQEFISVHGCSIVLIIALVSYGYISDYHKFSGLKQRKWISLGWRRAVFLSGTILGDNPFPYLLHLLEAACIACFMLPSNFKANNGWVSLSHILSLWHSSAFLFCI